MRISHYTLMLWDCSVITRVLHWVLYSLNNDVPYLRLLFLACTSRSPWKWIGRKETLLEFLTMLLLKRLVYKLLLDQWFTRIVLCSSSSVSLQENGLVPLQSYAFFIYFSLYVSSNDFSFFFFFGSLYQNWQWDK